MMGLFSLVGMFDVHKLQPDKAIYLIMLISFKFIFMFAYWLNMLVYCRKCLHYIQ